MRMLKYIAQVWGVRDFTPPNYQHGIGTVTVGTTPMRLTTADPSRISLEVSNTSANSIFIGFDSKMTVAQGIMLDTYAPRVLLNDDTHPGMAGRELWAVASAAGSVAAYAYTRLD